MNAHSPLWAEWIARASAVDILKVAARLGCKLKRTGGEAIGHCPAGCTKNGDGFAISIKKQIFICRPGDATGNVISLVRHAQGCGFEAALEFITGDTRPGGQKVEPEKRKRDEDAISGVLRRAVPIAGTHAAAYLKARGIDPAKKLTKDLRFVPDLEYWGRSDDEAPNKSVLATLPALVAPIRDVDGKVIGLHQTYLDATEPRKWTPTGATENRPKKIRGSVTGGLIRLGLIGDKLAIGEGIETTLKWYALGRGPPDVSIACGVSLGNLASAVLPDDAREIILLGDGDSDRKTTCERIVKAGRRLIETGKDVCVHFAPNGHDFADDDLEETPIEAFEPFAARVAEEFKPPFVSKFDALFMDALDAPGPEHQWLIDGWFSAGDRSIIGGKSLSGKSFLAIHAGMCVAHEKEFFGAAVRQGLVCYQAGEGRRGVKKRLRAWRKHYGIVFSRETPFVLLQSPIDLWRPDGDTAALIAEIKAIAALYPNIPLRMIVIDTLATATGGADENSFKDMSAVMANIAKINEATGAHVALVHHMNAGGEKLRGHTSIYANLDQVILVTRNEVTGVRTAVLDKQKDDVSDLRFQFELLSVGLGAEPDGAPITSCVCLPVGEKEAIRRTEESKGAALEADETIFMRALFEADRRHGEAVPADWNLPQEVRSVVNYTAVKRCYVSLNPSDAPPPDNPESAEEIDAAKKTFTETLRKRLQRLRERLTRINVIGAHDGRVYWTGRPLRAFPQTVAPDEDEPAEQGFGSDIPF